MSTGPLDLNHCVRAAVHIRKVRGESQSHLLVGDDGNLYVVKFQNNPQHQRLLANEWLGSHLATLLGLPVPAAKIIEVTDGFTEGNPEMCYERQGRTVGYRGGLQFGSTYIGKLFPSRAPLEYLPESMMHRLANPEAFLGFLLLDRWTCNADCRQAVFLPERHHFRAVGIDFGECFGSSSWKLKDCPSRGLTAYSALYFGAESLRSFDEWMHKLDTLDDATVWDGFRTMPEEWYQGDRMSAVALVDALIRRKKSMRQILQQLAVDLPKRFPSWSTGSNLPSALWGEDGNFHLPMSA